MKSTSSSSRSCWLLAILALISLSSLRSASAQDDAAYEYQYEYADYPYEDEYQDLPSSYYDESYLEYSDSYQYEGYGDYKPSTGVEPTPAAKPATSTPTPGSKPATSGATPTATPGPAASTPAGGKIRKRPKIGDKKNKIIEFAPEANITFGDDIDEEGKCEKEISKICDDVDEGEGKLADCMSDAIAESELGADDVPEVSDDCREEVYQFKISRNKNINKNIPLAKRCKKDADEFCNVTWFFGYKSGQVISCLRDVKKQVSKGCKQQLFKIQLDGAKDFRADPNLYEACKDDADAQCKGIKNGGGRIQGCLRDKRMSLTWACEEQLFRQEMENADDIRLSVRLFAKCLPDKRKFCKDVEPGHARAKECLEENREDLSSDCKDEVDSMIERRVKDFRLDPKLREVCEDEIFNMCAYFGDLDDIDTYDSSIINCLQDYTKEIKNDECRQQVRKYVALASEDIRFDVPLAEACFEDRTKFCAAIPPGSARVIRCLTSKRGDLSPICRATLFDEEVRFSENIDFQFPMKEACKGEIKRFCKDVPHGSSRVIRCLQDNRKAKDFGHSCTDEIASYEQEINKDYRLNYRLRTSCQSDVLALCSSVCQLNDGQVCGGKVLRCLTDKVDEIKAEACKKEVAYFEKMEVSNFRNDVILAEACRADVDKFCAKVQSGEGRVHKCLRENHKQLSETCRKEELLLEEKEATSIELNQGLVKTCKTERQLFCSEVQPGSARVFRCLAENMNDADFGANCKYQIIYKLQRRQANWKLDPPLRKACREDVRSSCQAEDAKDSEDGLVYQCLINKYENVQSGCQKELGRAVHMAFFVWQPGMILTQKCDEDIQKLCLADRPSMAQRPGAVGTCLASILEQQDRSSRRILVDKATTKELSSQCFTLADIAEPPNMKLAFESSLSVAALASGIENTVGVQGLTLRDRRGAVQGISLTGWVAMLGMAALIVLVLYSALMLYRHLRGERPEAQGYTLVVKKPTQGN